VPDDPGTPGYPPSRNTWDFPPPRTSAGWTWLAVLLGVVGLAVVVTLTAALVSLDRTNPSEVIEDDDLTSTIAAECALMTSTVASMPLSGATPQQAATIADQNRAIEVMVRSIRSANPGEIRSDQPAEQWLRDWERLVDARGSYARELLRDPGASLAVPRDANGVEITRRMRSVWPGDPVCEIPVVLVSPRTEAYSGV
jgi:hypothetical protein